LIPWPGLVLIGLVLIHVLATFVLFVPESAGGAPLIKDGRFFFNDHGVVREVTESEFHFQRSVLLRIYSSVWTNLSRRGDRSAVREASSQSGASTRLRHGRPIG